MPYVSYCKPLPPSLKELKSLKMKKYYSQKSILRICASVLILILLTQSSFSQEKKDSTVFYHFKKNSIKGFVFAFPIYGVSVSIGYERQLSKHSSIELVGYYWYTKNSMSVKTQNFCVMPAYKFYTDSKSEALNNIWIGVYLSYLYEIIDNPESEEIGFQYWHYYGAGISVGKRIKIGNNKTYLDLGFGASYNYYDDEPISNNNDWKQRIFLRPIIQIGQRF